MGFWAIWWGGISLVCTNGLCVWALNKFHKENVILRKERDEALAAAIDALLPALKQQAVTKGARK